MANVLKFEAAQFLDAQEAILEPSTDLVVVDDMVNPLKNDFNDNVEHLREMFAQQTPVIQNYWDKNHINGQGDLVQPWYDGIQDKDIYPHIDVPIYVAYIASANLSTKERIFYARREPIPDFLKANGEIDKKACRLFNQEVCARTIPQEDWIALKPGSVALFGAMPHLAVHAARGDTYDVMLYAWATHNSTP